MNDHWNDNHRNATGAKANNYWLVIVYHEVQKDGTPLCQNPNDDPALPTDPDPCVGPYDTTLGEFQQQLDYIASVGLGPDVMTVRDALNAANSQIHSPTAGTVAITPTQPTTGATLTATPSGFSDPDNAMLTYTYSWTVNGAAVPGATDATGAQFTVPQVKHGDTIAVTVSARNAAGYVSTGASDIVTVPNSPPAVGSVTIGPSAPTAGTALKATPSGFADADGDALTYEYAWFESGQPISGVTGSTLPGSSVLPGTVSVEVRAVDGYGGRSDPANAAMVVTAASAGGQSNPGAGQPTPGGGQPNPGGGHPTPVVDKTPPQIVVMSPTRPIYRLGQTLLLKFACSDGSGVADCSATLGLVSGKPGSVTSGQKVRLSKSGLYVLRITAKDREGNSGSRTLYFRVTNYKTPPGIAIVSPTAKTYRAGQLLLVKFTAHDPSGVAGSWATLGPVGRKAGKVTSGEKVRLSKRGLYVLRITAKDGVGSFGGRTLYFTVK